MNKLVGNSGLNKNELLIFFLSLFFLELILILIFDITVVFWQCCEFQVIFVSFRSLLHCPKKKVVIIFLFFSVFNSIQCLLLPKQDIAKTGITISFSTPLFLSSLSPQVWTLRKESASLYSVFRWMCSPL